MKGFSVGVESVEGVDEIDGERAVVDALGQSTENGGDVEDRGELARRRARVGGARGERAAEQDGGDAETR